MISVTAAWHTEQIFVQFKIYNSERFESCLSILQCNYFNSLKAYYCRFLKLVDMSREDIGTIDGITKVKQFLQHHSENLHNAHTSVNSVSLTQRLPCV